MPATCRLKTYERRLVDVLENPNAYIAASDADRLTFDLREIDEIVEIVAAFDAEPTHEEVERLRLLPKGPEDADLPGDHTARDAQYELYLRAVFKRAQVMVEVAEPDLLIWYGDNCIQIAAKRPNTEARLDDRLRSAVKQLEKRDYTGVAALSLDHIIRPNRHLISVPMFADLAPAVAHEVQAFTTKNALVFAKRVRDRRIDAILFTARLPGRLSTTNHAVLGSSLHVEILADAGTQQAETIRHFVASSNDYLA